MDLEWKRDENGNDVARHGHFVGWIKPKDERGGFRAMVDVYSQPVRGETLGSEEAARAWCVQAIEEIEAPARTLAIAQCAALAHDAAERRLKLRDENARKNVRTATAYHAQAALVRLLACDMLNLDRTGGALDLIASKDAELRSAREELETARRELTAERDRRRQSASAAVNALDEIAAACGCADWEYPGQVVRDVGTVLRERNEAMKERDEARAERDAISAAREKLLVALESAARDTRASLSRDLAMRALQLGLDALERGETEPPAQGVTALYAARVVAGGITPQDMAANAPGGDVDPAAGALR